MPDLIRKAAHQDGEGPPRQAKNPDDVSQLLVTQTEVLHHDREQSGAMIHRSSPTRPNPKPSSVTAFHS